MKSSIIQLIQDCCENNNFKDIEDIYTLYDQLQYANSIYQIAEDIYKWLHVTYNIDNLNFSIFDIEQNNKKIIFTQGEEFFLDDESSFFFIINTHTNINAILSFNVASKTHYTIIQEKYHIIQAAFFQISPIVQNGILKKNYIESSSIDSVTNVYNRKYFIKNLNKHLLLSGNQHNQISLLMVGIDHFKAVIDEFDYDIGDIVLVELAKIIHANIQEFDLVARLTGDEFIVALTHHHKQSDITNIAEKIVKDFSHIEVKVDNKGHILKKTICIGIDSLTMDQQTNSIDEAIKNADIALYEAKNKGRGQINYFQKEQSSTIDLF